jgi:hypothetical protein
MIVDMQGRPVQTFAPLTKSIEIFVDSRLEDERIEDLTNNYLLPFLQQLQVPVIKIEI